MFVLLICVIGIIRGKEGLSYLYHNPHSVNSLIMKILIQTVASNQ